MHMLGTLTTLFIAAVTVTVCVFIHTRGLFFLSRFVEQERPRIERFTLGVLLLHLIEIMLFALVTMLAAEILQLGTLQGVAHPGFEDYAYFSIVCYTTLGFGEIVPTGHLRLLSGIEAVTGLVLITWSASFGFLKLEGKINPRQESSLKK